MKRICRSLVETRRRIVVETVVCVLVSVSRVLHVGSLQCLFVGGPAGVNPPVEFSEMEQ